MAVVPSRVTVTAVAGVLARNDAKYTGRADEWNRRSYLIKNVTASETVFLGGAGVATTTGFAWAAGDGALEVNLEPGEELLAIRGGLADQEVHVLAQGR